jgi:hypothetical protein
MLHRVNTLLSGVRKKDRAKVIPQRGIEEKYLKHALQDPLLNHLQKSRIVNLPVCGNCERLAVYDRRAGDPPVSFFTDRESGMLIKNKPHVTCPVCGYHGPGGPSLRMHVREV